MASLINDKRFNIWFSNKPTTSGVYRYDVSINGALVFVGNAYLEANENPIIDVTDIIKNYVDVNRPPFAATGEKSSIYKTVDVKIYINDTNLTLSSDVFMLYENPHYNSKVSTMILDNFAPQNINTMPMLQGWDYGANEGYLLPTYPTIPSDNFTFDMVCGYQNMPIVNSIKINYNTGLTDIPTYLQLDGNGVYQYSLPLSWILRGIDGSATVCDATSMDIETFSPINTNQRYKYTIAKFDNQSRYFLKWKDRYGMPQVQPFGGTYKYSESINKNTITNYKNSKKIIDISNTPRWALNSKWIKQEYYPFYESIFVSPYLQLFDAKEDKLYNVILTNTEYDEKTFNNLNRLLFNIQLEVELDTTETMIY